MEAKGKGTVARGRGGEGREKDNEAEGIGEIMMIRGISTVGKCKDNND